MKNNSEWRESRSSEVTVKTTIVESSVGLKKQNIIFRTSNDRVQYHTYAGLRVY